MGRMAIGAFGDRVYAGPRMGLVSVVFIDIPVHIDLANTRIEIGFRGELIERMTRQANRLADRRRGGGLYGWRSCGRRSAG